MNIIDYFNPFHTGFEQAEINFHQLKGWQKAVAVIASIAAGILTPFLFCSGSIAAFRWTVEQLFKGEDKQADESYPSEEDDFVLENLDRYPSEEDDFVLENLDRYPSEEDDYVLEDLDRYPSEEDDYVLEDLEVFGVR